MNLTKETIYSFARWLSAYIFGVITGPLVSHNVITADLSTRLQSAVESAIGLAITSLVMFVAPMLWSWWRNVIAKNKMVLAYYLDPDHQPLSEAHAMSDKMTARERLDLVNAA